MTEVVLNKRGHRNMAVTLKKLNVEIDDLQKKLGEIANEKIDLELNLAKNIQEKNNLKKIIENKDQEILLVKKALQKNEVLQKNEKKLEEKLITWYEKLDEEINENAQLSLKNRKLLKNINQLKIEKKQLENKIESIKHHLSYTLGNAFVSTKFKLKDVTQMPKRILNSYKKYYDYKVIRSHFNNDMVVVNDINNELRMPNIVPLRHGVKETFINYEYIKLNSFINLYSHCSKVNSTNEIICEIIVLNGKLNFKNLINNTNVFLNEKETYSHIFSIDDQEYLRFLEFIDYTSDVYVSIKWSKKRGKPLFLEINNKLNFKENKIQSIVSEEIKYKIPLKPATHLLWNASNIAEDFGYNSAIDYFNKYSKEKNKNSLHILKANMFHENEEKWLKEVNLYIEKYSIEKIKLNDNNGLDRFLRIECNSLLKNINSDILISVIMPAYNAENTIKKAINSILSQTWINLELIVVNDNSSDNTLNVIKEINDPRLKVINNIENVGAYVSKNIGLKYSNGAYITGHDSDDWAHPRRLENHMKSIINNNNPRASLTRMIRMDKQGYFSHIGKEGTFCTDGVLRIASITCMFERNFLINQLGAWDCVRMGADSEIIARAKIILGEEFKIFDQISMICLDAEGSLTNDPVHGVSKVSGISDTRKAYRNSWLAWHENLTEKSNLKLEFPPVKRVFDAPEAICVNFKDILRNLK